MPLGTRASRSFLAARFWLPVMREATPPRTPREIRAPAAGSEEAPAAGTAVGPRRPPAKSQAADGGTTVDAGGRAVFPRAVAAAWPSLLSVSSCSKPLPVARSIRHSS